MSLIQTFPDGGGGGTNIPNGSTVTPTNDISIWLKCAGLTETYTTLNEVLADDDVMEKLFRSENASDYLVRSTTWASGITANQTAMILIGKNDYCADKLLGDSTWSAAISASTYWNEVLKGLVPVMTSNITPYGEASMGSNPSANASYAAWKVFDGDDSTSSLAIPFDNRNTDGEVWIQYKFTSPVRVNKVDYRMFYQLSYEDKRNTVAFKIQGSNDGNTWADLYTANNYQYPNDTDAHSQDIANSNKYIYYRIWYSGCPLKTSGYFCYYQMLQFYGRASKTTIYSAANDIVSFVDDEGAKVVTTDSMGKGEVSIVCKPNTDITFTSSVAKDPDNLSENYSKVVTVKSSAEPVYVMPNDALYWFGYKSSEYEVCSTANGWTAGAFNVPTENTNYLNCKTLSSSGSGTTFSGIGYSSKKTTNTIKVICQGITANNGSYTFIFGTNSKNIDDQTNRHYALFANNTLSCVSQDTSSWGNQNISVGAGNIRETNIYAVWYENGDDGNYDKADADLIAPVQKTLTAKKAYAVGEQFVYNQTLYRVAQAIAQGATITIGTNAILAGSVTEQINNSYSTTEKKTGDLWIDGKEIYQKVIDFGTLPNSTLKLVDSGTQIKECVSIEFMTLSSGPNEYRNVVPGVVEVGVYAYDSNQSNRRNNVYIVTNIDKSNLSCKIIIRYTKP